MPFNLFQSLPLMPRSEDIMKITQRLNAERRAIIDEIIKNVDPTEATYANVIKPLAILNNSQSGERSMIAALRYAAPEMVTQRAVEDASNLPREEQGDIAGRLDYHKLVKIVNDNHEDLDEEDQAMLSTILRRGDDQVSQENEQELQDICALFNRNIRQHETNSLLFSDSELAGLPAEYIATYTLSENGKRSVPVQKQELHNILSLADEPGTRKQMLSAWSGRHKANASLFARAVKLRHQDALSRGYRTFADSVMEDRMADSVNWVLELLQRLADAMVPKGREHLASLQAEKVAHCGREDAHLKPWDVEYYNHRIEARSAVNHDEIAEYFPLEHTFNSMLDIFGSNLQMQFFPVTQSDMTGHIWADEVQVFSVYDQRPEHKGDFIGYLYRDILQRPNKFKHNQAVNLQPGYIKPDGSTMPVTTIMCYLGDVNKHGCRLLTHRQVQSLFHELGHCIHDLVSRTRYSRFHGFEVKMEFGEAIGTMLEQWVWNPEVLRSMTRHYTTLDTKYERSWLETHADADLPPEKLPDHVLENLVHMRSKSRLALHLQQLSESMFDLMVHFPQEEILLKELDDMKLDAMYENLQRTYLGISRPDLGYMHTSFNHLMSGMEAGYYAYLCANVFAEELYLSAFSNGRHADVLSWDRFRRSILVHGGSKDALQMLRDFCGHHPSPDALLRSLGLTTD